MAHSLQKGRCSRGVYRLVLFLVGAVLVGYNVGPPFHERIKKNSSVVPASCPCFCECSSELGLALPLGECELALNVKTIPKMVTFGGLHIWVC